MLAFVNATVIDGTGTGPLVHQTVLIEKDRIAALGAAIPVPEGAVQIDLTGLTLLPGFIDAHTHIGGNAGFSHPPHTGRIHSYDFAESREQFLSWGVTTVRDAGGFMPDCVEVRDLVEQGKLRGPRIVAAGRMIQAQGGHPWCSVFFKNKEIKENELFFVGPETDSEELERMVEREVQEGVDWIKVVCSDDNCMDWPNHLPRLSMEQLRVLVETGHKYNKPVMAHCDDFDDIQMALEVGADSFEHTINNGAQTGLAPTDQLLELMAASGAWVVPTIVATAHHDGSIEGAHPVLGYALDGVRKMIQAGVKLGVGCDSGIPFVPFGESLHEELSWLVKAGMSPLQAISAATWQNARLLRLENEVGAVMPGMKADLVVCEGNPAACIEDTKKIRIVVRNGSIVEDRLLSTSC